MINIRKRGNNYQYCFEAGKVNGKRKQITKCGFRTKNKAFVAGKKHMMNLLMVKVLQNVICYILII